MKRIKVTREQVIAARLELKAFEAADLRPDPMVRKLAMAEGMYSDEAPAEQLQFDPAAFAAMFVPKADEIRRELMRMRTLHAMDRLTAEEVLSAFPKRLRKDLQGSLYSASPLRPPTDADLAAAFLAVTSFTQELFAQDRPLDVEVDEDEEIRRGS